MLRPYLRQKTGNPFIIDSEKKLGFTRDELVEALTYIKDCYDGGVFEPAEDSATFKAQIHTNPKWMDGKFVFGYGASSNINLLMDAIPETECTVVQIDVYKRQQKEVADLLGISQSYISRLEKKIMKRLKKEIVRFE